MKTYIHYGDRHFDPNKFKPIENTFTNKPIGGLWASDVNAKYGWKEWNKSSGLRKCSEEPYFKLTLDKKAKVLNVHKYKDVKFAVKEFLVNQIMILDFKKIMKRGYDAMEVFISDSESLYWNLYGYDCDSIIIFNKDIIQEVK